jgi:hypothetical protein
VLQDFRFALRQLIRHPLFAAVAVATPEVRVRRAVLAVWSD